MNIDSLWEYSDPAASEARFREALELTQGDERLELLTQIARTHSLRQNFTQANEILNEIESQLANAGARPRVRTLLERGRVYNSAGEVEKARPLFVEALEQAQAAHEDGLAVDAAHMVAITYSGTPESLVWNQRGLTLARASQDPKATSMVPAMLNNMAWDLHDLGRFNDALPLFEDAQVEWAARSRPVQTRIAKWSVARCLRSLERYEEALALQREIESEHQADGTSDRFVFEEIAENLAALGQHEQAKPYYEKAAAMKGQDE